MPPRQPYYDVLSHDTRQATYSRTRRPADPPTSPCSTPTSSAVHAASAPRRASRAASELRTPSQSQRPQCPPQTRQTQPRQRPNTTNMTHYTDDIVRDDERTHPSGARPPRDRAPAARPPPRDGTKHCTHHRSTTSPRSGQTARQTGTTASPPAAKRRGATMHAATEDPPQPTTTQTSARSTPTTHRHTASASEADTIRSHADVYRTHADTDAQQPAPRRDAHCQQYTNTSGPLHRTRRTRSQLDRRHFAGPSRHAATPLRTTLRLTRRRQHEPTTQTEAHEHSDYSTPAPTRTRERTATAASPNASCRSTLASHPHPAIDPRRPPAPHHAQHPPHGKQRPPGP